MNMSARFDGNPAMTLQDIKETKRYGGTDTRTDNMKTVYPPQTKFAGGIKILEHWSFLLNSLQNSRRIVHLILCKIRGQWSFPLNSL